MYSLPEKSNIEYRYATNTSCQFQPAKKKPEEKKTSSLPLNVRARAEMSNAWRVARELFRDKNDRPVKNVKKSRATAWFLHRKPIQKKPGSFGTNQSIGVCRN